MTATTFLDTLQQQVSEAATQHTPLVIQAGSSKAFYGHRATGQIIDLRTLNTVVDYEPSELYITVLAGTRIREVEQLLKEHHQMMAFEPPHFGPDASIGGMLATGLCGPRRPYGGSVRDAVLGVQLINGLGEYLQFGGQVMKNVAGYDVSRLMVGAMGTLGIITQATIKVIPQPQAEITCAFECTAEQALQRCVDWNRQCLPLSATFYSGGLVYIRLSGTEQSVRTAHQQTGGESVEQSHLFWQQVREQKHAFFQQSKPLWRISLPITTSVLDLAGDWAFEWNGGLRWYMSNESEKSMRSAAARFHGHATLFRQGTDSAPVDNIFHPLPKTQQALQSRIKHAFDPYNILNRNRMYAFH